MHPVWVRISRYIPWAKSPGVSLTKTPVGSHGTIPRSTSVLAFRTAHINLHESPFLPPPQPVHQVLSRPSHELFRFRR